MMHKTPETPDTPDVPEDAVVRDDEAVSYTTPALSDLGSVAAVTAGPHSGNLDQLVGGSGGFIDTTS